MNCTQKNMKEQGRFLAKRPVFQNAKGNGEQGAEKIPVQPESKEKEIKSPRELLEQFKNKVMPENPSVEKFNAMFALEKSLSPQNPKVEYTYTDGDKLTATLENGKAVWRKADGVEIQKAVWLQQKTNEKPQ